MRDKLFFEKTEPSFRIANSPGEVMFVIDKDGCHVPYGVSVDESAKAVIEALDAHIKNIVNPLKQQRDELLEALENWINALDEPSAWMECRDNAKKAIAKAKEE